MSFPSKESSSRHLPLSSSQTLLVKANGMGDFGIGVLLPDARFDAPVNDFVDLMFRTASYGHVALLSR